MSFISAVQKAQPTYNLLKEALLILFLFIYHFLIVIILITLVFLYSFYRRAQTYITNVLINSFMTIVSNANEEHEFVFIINIISMVKNDALFSYIAPSNIFAQILTSLSFCLPFYIFIKVNCIVIKIIHGKNKSCPTVSAATGLCRFCISCIEFYCRNCTLPPLISFGNHQLTFSFFSRKGRLQILLHHITRSKRLIGH